jgi:hypothetical protein
VARVFGEELGECVEGIDASFGGGGQAVLDDREVGEALNGAPAFAGGTLLDFHGPDSALGLFAGKSDGQVGGEPLDHVYR